MALALRASATSTGASITVPATAEAGDWAVLFQMTTDSVGETRIVPTGWQTSGGDGSFSGDWNTGPAGTPAVSWVACWKILEESDIGASVTGMDGDDTDNKIMLVFYGSAPLSNPVFGGPVYGAPLAGDLPSQVIAASGGTPPLIVIGFAGVNNAAGTFSTASPAFDAQVNVGNIRAGYKIYNSSPANHTIDKTDQGQRNFLGGFYVSLTEAVVYDLSAPNVTIGTPTVGNPALTQAHQLAASALSLAAPTAGNPAMTQVHVLAAAAMALSAHVVGNPVLTPIHVLGAAAVSLSAHVVGNPTLSSIYNFTAPALTIGGHVAGTPALSQAHSLAVGETELAAPVVGHPAMTQAHILGANSVALAAHVFGSPNVREGTFFVRSGNFQLPLIWVKTGGVWVEVEEVSFRRNGAWQSLYRN